MESDKSYTADEIEAIIEDAKNITNNNNDEFKKKYKDFKDSCPGIFDMIINKNCNFELLKTLVEHKKLMEKGFLTEEKASEKVGSILVDKFVKPNLS